MEIITLMQAYMRISFFLPIIGLACAAAIVSKYLVAILPAESI